MLYFKIHFREFILIPLIFEAVNHVWGGDNYFSTSFGTGGKDAWNDALNIMSYHRSKMNEYLCRNYLASEIVEDMQNRSTNSIENRSEAPSKYSRIARDSLLNDSGSEKYKDWLSRSSTLEDIYRQFEHSDGDHHEPDYGHEGEVTGYALVGQKHAYGKPVEYGDSHYLDSHSYEYHKEDEHEEDDHEDKGLKLKELFHFALTAIAFLAFATFMIEVIMCLMDASQPTDTDYVLMPTTTGATGPASKIEPGNMSSPRRQERMLNIDPVSMSVLNEMSSRVLSSIEALTILHEDDGECLKRVLCQNSKYSRSLKGMQKVWLPIWSFGASWLAGKLKKQTSSPELSSLSYLKSAVMGLGNRECQLLYPKCVGKMKGRRKKRNVS